MGRTGFLDDGRFGAKVSESIELQPASVQPHCDHMWAYLAVEDRGGVPVPSSVSFATYKHEDSQKVSRTGHVEVVDVVWDSRVRVVRISLR